MVLPAWLKKKSDKQEIKRMQKNSFSLTTSNRRLASPPAHYFRYQFAPDGMLQAINEPREQQVFSKFRNSGRTSKRIWPPLVLYTRRLNGNLITKGISSSPINTIILKSFSWGHFLFIENDESF
jgi:hypothetical protein